jgi:hypothetical protein
MVFVVATNSQTPLVASNILSAPRNRPTFFHAVRVSWRAIVTSLLSSRQVDPACTR